MLLFSEVSVTAAPQTKPRSPADQKSARFPGMRTGLCAAGLALLVTVGCSTVTPFRGDAAQRSPHFGKLSKADAVNVVRSQARPGSGMADAGSFGLDEAGFGFKRTTKETRTEYRDGGSVTITSTVWIVRNVPWNAVVRTSAYFRDYQFLFTDEYVVDLTYRYSDFDGGRRTSTDESFSFLCRTEPDMLDTLAALEALRNAE